jgi:hypothetical protein
MPDASDDCVLSLVLKLIGFAAKSVASKPSINLSWHWNLRQQHQDYKQHRKDAQHELSQRCPELAPLVKRMATFYTWVAVDDRAYFRKHCLKPDRKRVSSDCLL